MYFDKYISIFYIKRLYIRKKVEKVKKISIRNGNLDGQI